MRFTDEELQQTVWGELFFKGSKEAKAFPNNWQPNHKYWALPVQYKQTNKQTETTCQPSNQKA